jgi:DNA-directed RNA polymerase subunit M/transcription elongation factor TFIIS
MKIRFAKELIEKLEYSNYDDYETYPNSVFVCDKCGDKIGFGFKDLEKHRFSKNSNLKGKDKIIADRLILTMIPKYKVKQKRQIWALTKRDRLIVKLQRLYLRLIGAVDVFLPIPKIDENIPDSFIDFNCPKCKTPVRIYYFSFIGGRHCENGFVIKYVIN